MLLDLKQAHRLFFLIALQKGMYMVLVAFLIISNYQNILPFSFMLGAAYIKGTIVGQFVRTPQ